MKKCAIVTGGSSGIGKAVAQTLAKQECNVVIGDMNEETGSHVAELMGAYFVKVDLTKAQSCKTLVEEAVKKYNRVDILVNNAGFQHVCPLEDFPEEK
ncbi:MAG: SDR family NAD(P)-dependent oxidoreductase [Pseudomonadota bacterium]